MWLWSLNRDRKSLMYRTPHFSAITKPFKTHIVFDLTSYFLRCWWCSSLHPFWRGHWKSSTPCFRYILWLTLFQFVLFQLYVLKLLKMQTKYLGRQWRKSNMKTMSAIYTKVSPTAMDLEILEYVCQIFLHHQHNQTFVFLIFRNLRWDTGSMTTGPLATMWTQDLGISRQEN